MSTRWISFLVVIGLCFSLASCHPGSQPNPLAENPATPGTHVSLHNMRAIVTLAPIKNKPVFATSSPTATRTATATPIASVTTHPLLQTELAGIPTDAPCIMKGGRMVITSHHSRMLKLPLDYRVYLPPCYDVNTDHRYPVLYLMHGQSFTDDQWDRMGMDEKANRLIAEGQIPELIIVMPRDRYGGQPSESQFGEVFINELLPLIDREYRTKPERSWRAIGGLSRGAGWSVHLALNNWKLFGILSAHSPAIFFEDAQHMRDLLDAIPRTSLPRIFMDVGDKDRPEIMQAADWFEALLNERAIPHEFYVFSGYHDEAYWKGHIELYLRWYTATW